MTDPREPRIMAYAVQGKEMREALREERLADTMPPNITETCRINTAKVLAENAEEYVKHMVAGNYDNAKSYLHGIQGIFDTMRSLGLTRATAVDIKYKAQAEAGVVNGSFEEDMASLVIDQMWLTIQKGWT